MRAATFTTYINAQTDPGLEAAFARQTRVATSSYATITQAAKEASRATAGLLAGQGTAGLTATTRALDSQARSTFTTAKAAADAERAIARATNALRSEERQATRTSETHRNLSRSLNTTATAFSVVEGRMSPLAGRLVTVARAAEQLSGLQLGLAGVGATLFALGRAGNEYATLASRLRPFYDSQRDANRAMEDVIGIASRSRTSLESVVEIYARLTANSKELGLSQDRVGRLTEFASKAATLSGGSKAARDAALVQFSQAIGSNFQSGAGQEFNSLQEGASQVSTLLARYFKNADGSIGTTIANLKKLSSEGKLTTAQIADAADRARPALEAMFAAIPKTLGSAGTEFSNSLTVMVGRFDQSVGATSKLAETISLVANNLRGAVLLAGLLTLPFTGPAFARGVGTLQAVGKAAIANVTGIIEQVAAVKELDAAWIRDSEVTAAAYAARVEELQAERNGIRQSIVDITRKADAQAAASAKAIQGYEAEAVAARQAQFTADRLGGASVTGTTSVRGKSFPIITTAAASGAQADAGIAKILREQAVAAENATKSQLATAAATQRLAAVNAELRATSTAAATAQTALGTATANVAGRVGLLRSVGGSLVSFLGGPWGIAFAAATTAVYLLATAESAAERATRLHEDAQRSFAGIIDQSTGKIYDQIDGLQKLAVARKLQIDVDDADKQFGKSRAELIELARKAARPLNTSQATARAAGFANPVTGEIDDVTARQIAANSRRPSQTASQRELGRLADNFAANRPGSFKAFQDGLARLSPKIPALGKVIDDAARLGNDVRSSYDRSQRGQAAARITTGRGRAGDTALALGVETRTTNGGASARPRTKAQVLAAARQEAASTPLQKAQADYSALLASTDSKGLLPGRDAVQTQHELAAAMQQVTAAKQAQTAASKGASAAAAADRKAARDAVQDAKDEAAARRDAATEALLKTNPDTSSSAFLAARQKILATYDAEINKIDASAAASHSATTQRLADLKREEDAAPGRGEKRSDILANYDDAPKAVDKARDQVNDLQKNVGHLVDGIQAVSDANPLGRGLYTQEIANADAARIEYGLRKPIRDIQQESTRNLQIAQLQLSGYDDQAEALRRSFGLLETMGEVRSEDYDTLLGVVRQEQRVNDLLASRSRITDLIKGSVDEARGTFESFLLDLPNGARKAAGGALQAFEQQFLKIKARQLTERIFAGADAKVRELLTGKADVNGAMRDYVEKLGTGKDAVVSFGQSLTATAQKVKDAFADIGSPSGGIGGSNIGTSPLNVGASLANTVAGGNQAAAAFFGTLSAAVGDAANDNAGSATAQKSDEIVVTGTKLLKQTAQLVTPANKIPTTRDLSRTLFKGIGDNIDDALHGLFGSGKKGADGKHDTSKGGVGGLGNTQFFGKLGDAVGKGVAGAATGTFVAGITKSLGLKTSKTGAQVGGAIGSITGIPGADIIGSIAGGLLGGAFKKTKKGYANDIKLSADGTAAFSAGGNSTSRQKAAGTLASGLGDSLQNIATSLGAKLDTTLNLGSLGQKKDKFTFDATSGTSAGKQTFDTSDEAVAAAVKNAVSKGVLTGISQASQNILKSGQDLEKAVTKAGVIESIPKRLLQLQDPVRYAVTQLNDEFSTMISYLQEGGATAGQFADAQKLYDLERADAIKQATQNASSAIDDFLREMTSGSGSPFSKRTTYTNASSALNQFSSDIQNGKAVNQDDLLTAARNFQDASRSLNGSSSAFFSDFDMLRSLLSQASDNAKAGVAGASTGALPASPFESSSVQSALTALQGATTSATQSQTDQLSSDLKAVRDAVLSLGGTGGTGGSAIKALLPAFANAA